mmetsp:Transcript_43808/g.91140  ORF Transcript_43808/g.91140 Transcript_43808/m.91140 type:complete len:526 (+) Transcript_43808:107-1684(+)
MAMVRAGTQEMEELAQKAIAMVQDCIEGAEDDEKVETKDKLQNAKRVKGSEALIAALSALETLMQETLKGKVFMDQFNADGELASRTMAVMGTRPHKVMARLREALWLAKDANALFKDAGDKMGQAASQLALVRIHLMRSSDPDGAPAAMRAATEAVRLLKRSGEPKKEAMAYCALAEANYMKGVLTIIEAKREAAFEASMSAAKDSAAIFRELGDKKNEGVALMTLAVTLSAMSDEDRTLEGERYAGDAKELFKDSKEKELEKDAALLVITARWECSGPETALMLAEETISDWRADGNRELHEAAALKLRAEVNLELAEHTESLKMAQEALRLCVRSVNRKQEAEVLHTIGQIHLAMKNNDLALQSLQEMVTAYESIGDKQMVAFAQGLVGELLLTTLANEVVEDTVAIHEKKEAPNKLAQDDVYRRNEEGIDYCFKALDNYQSVGDTNGLDSVNKLMDDVYQQGVNVYCQTTEPDQLFMKLEVGGVKTKKTWKEWNIEMPRVMRALAEEQRGLGGGEKRLALQ